MKFSSFSFRYVVFLKLIALYSQQLRAAKEQKEVCIRLSIIVELHHCAIHINCIAFFSYFMFDQLSRV